MGGQQCGNFCKIRSGKTETCPSAGSAADNARHAVRMPQEFRRPTQRTAANEFANTAGRNEVAVGFDRTHNTTREGCSLTESLEHRRVPLSIATKSKIWPLDNALRVKRIYDHRVKELLGRHLQQGICDRQHDH